MVNSVSNSLAGTNTNNIMQRDYVIIDGKRYPVQKRQSHNPLISTLAPVYKDVVVIDGKEYPVQEVSDNMYACDKTKKVVIVNGEEYDVNPSFPLKSIFGQGITINKSTQNQDLNYVV